MTPSRLNSGRSSRTPTSACTAFAFLGLSQWGRFRLESNLSLRREVFTDFYVGLRGYESYDSEPATEGAQKNDWGLTLTLGYTF